MSGFDDVLNNAGVCGIEPRTLERSGNSKLGRLLFQLQIDRLCIHGMFISLSVHGVENVYHSSWSISFVIIF